MYSYLFDRLLDLMEVKDLRHDGVLLDQDGDVVAGTAHRADGNV